MASLTKEHHSSMTCKTYTPVTEHNTSFLIIMFGPHIVSMQIREEVARKIQERFDVVEVPRLVNVAELGLPLLRIPSCSGHTKRLSLVFDS